MFSKAMIEKILNNLIETYLKDTPKEFTLNISGKILKITIVKEREIDDDNND